MKELDKPSCIMSGSAATELVAADPDISFNQGIEFFIQIYCLNLDRLEEYSKVE